MKNMRDIIPILKLSELNSKADSMCNAEEEIFQMNMKFPEGFELLHGYLDVTSQLSLLEELRTIVAKAPFFTPTMPKSGKPFSVSMTNCGTLGWVSDRNGYRYQNMHPETGHAWPEMPKKIIELWKKVIEYPKLPQACLINYYGKGAKLGLHKDEDEEDMAAPVFSLSLGDDCLFRIGGQNRSGPTQSVRLNSGDVVILGGHSRTCFHGIDRVYFGTSNLLKNGGRINLTVRRVSN